MDTRPAPGMRSIVKSTSRLGGSSGISFGKTSAYSSTIVILLILSAVLNFFALATIMKHVAPSSISFTAYLEEINSNPAVSGNTTLRRPQLITTWLLDNQSIPRITSRPSMGKQIRFTLNLWPATSIGHPTQIELVDTSPDSSVGTINSHPSSCITSLSFLTHSLNTNEWVDPESYNTTTRLPNNKQVSYTRLPDWVASVVVSANTRPGALGLSPTGLLAGAPPTGFLLGQCLA